MKVCPYCGRYCDDNAMICANCGGTLPMDANAAPAGNAAGYGAAGGFAAGASFGSNPGPENTSFRSTAPQPNPYAQQAPYQTNPYPQQAPYQTNPYATRGPEVNPAAGKMPSKGLHLTLTILGFLLGVLWGILCMGPYKAMSAAILNGDVEEAKKNAKKIRTFFIIGMVVNVLFVVGRMAQGG